MIDLIDRKRLLNSRVYSTRSGKPNYEKMLKNLVNDILTAPTVDTERHAHWEQPSYFDEDNNVFQCSNCKEEFALISGSPKENGYEYCPHCGCKMDEVKNERKRSLD